MTKSDLPKDFLVKLKGVRGKRARTVVDHILKHGHITTEDLKVKYGYDHPPRAVRDVREQGIPIETFHAVGTHGRPIAAYRFGNPAAARGASHRGRQQWPKDFKNALVGDSEKPACLYCQTSFGLELLQIDHRVPYEVAGDAGVEAKVEDHALACRFCNRAKSWCCEHCENWKTTHDIKICKTCFWASPENYSHVALMRMRRLEVVWVDSETTEHIELGRMAKAAGKSIQEMAKQLIGRAVRKKRP